MRSRTTLPAVIGAVWLGSIGLRAVTSADLTMEAFLKSRWPSAVQWSPDGKYVSFLWTDWTSQNLHVVPASGGRPVGLTASREFLGGRHWELNEPFGDWAPDAQSMVYASEGDLFAVSVSGGQEQLTNTAETEAQPRFSPDGRSIAFWRDGVIWVCSRKSPSLAQPLPIDGRASQSFRWSPDGEWISTTTTTPAVSHTAVHQSLGSVLAFRWSRRSQRDAALISVAALKTRLLLESDDDEAVIDWSSDGRVVLVERRNSKSRSLWAVALDAGSPVLLYRQRDDRHIATNNQVARFSPDGATVLFTSDEDGWNHLYEVSTNGGRPRQITRGRFEVRSPDWSPDGHLIYFESTEVGADQPNIYVVERDGSARTRLTQGLG